jgi:glycine cleavage system H protein
MGPEGIKFAETHEWAKVEKGGNVAVGISEYAVHELRDITYIELPAVGDSVTMGDPFGEVESVKTVAELVSPCDGEVAAVNEAAVDNPGILSKDPYGAGWLIKIKAADADQLDELMTSDEYESFIEDEAAGSEEEEEEEEEEDEEAAEAEEP